MRIQDALFSIFGKTIPSRVTFPPSPRLAQARREIERRFETQGQARGIDLADLLRRLILGREKGHWDIRGWEWRHTVHCLTKGDSPLLDDQAFMSEYLSRLGDMPGRPVIRALIRFFLEQFNPTRPGLVRIGAFLSGQVERWDWEWASRHREAFLFDAGRAPKQLAALARQDDSPLECLARFGLASSLASARLAGHSFLMSLAAFCRMLETDPSTDELEKLLAWAAHEGAFRYASVPETIPRLAEVLLLPWMSANPPQPIQSRIERFLLDHFKDLRVSGRLWKDVDERARQVMRRWLTKASLEQYLEVVDRIAVEHMWSARREFWGAYHKAGYLQEAWVVFAREGAAIARKMSQEDKTASVCFGRFDRSTGVMSNHAVLVMKIGDLTVVDWSHIGKCHIWRRWNDNAPSLYKDSYSRSELTSGTDLSKAHHSTIWQRAVHDFIHQHTGIRLW